MSSAPEQITVQCPSCGVQFQAWKRVSTGHDLDGFDAAIVDETSTVTCPACGSSTDLDNLVVEEGIFHFPNE